MTFSGFIETLGARLGMEIENAGGAAAVEIDGAVVVLQDAGEFLLLRAEIGELPDEGCEALLASAMKANFLYQGTGGGTLAINPADGKLHIQKYNWMDRIDAESGLVAIGNLSDTAAAWRRILADYHPDAVNMDSSPIGAEPFLQV